MRVAAEGELESLELVREAVATLQSDGDSQDLLALVERARRHHPTDAGLLELARTLGPGR